MKRFLKKLLAIIIVLLLVVIVLLGAVWFGGPWILSFSVAEYEGDIDVPHISHPVEMTFDAKGIPQTWTETNSDLLFSIGWLHASERLFQMELIRRMAAGELSEVFGDIAYELDLFQRKIGFKRIAEQGMESLDSETRHFLEQYCRGINTWIEHKTILPPEFVLLRITPRAWTPLDCLTIMVYQTWFSHAGRDQNPEYHELIKKFGDTLEEQLREPLRWSPATIQEKALSSVFEHDRFPFRMAEASNSWAVSPHKSTTGAALHANDPHLSVSQIPGFWYIMGLHSAEGLAFLGVTTPGLPFGAMGHNGSIAYSFTVAGVDIFDYYIYQRHPDDQTQILTEKGYQQLRGIEEEIRVKGEDTPRKATVYMTERGVIVEETETELVALQWVGFDFNAGNIMNSAIALLKAQNFSEFRESVTGLGALDANWIYSDVLGNIGYQLGPPIPQRGYTDTFRHQSGADASTAWQGYYALPDTPYAYNPKEGWIATCNNRIVPEDWPYELPGFYLNSRITRVKALLSQQERYSPQDFATMQMDIVSGTALQWKDLLARGAEQLGHHDLAEEITKWDGQMALDSEVAALFMYWWEYLPKALFEDDLGKEWRKGSMYLREIVLSQQIRDLIDDERTSDRAETMVDIAAMALKDVLPVVKGKTVKDIRIFNMRHPLSSMEILNTWLHLNRGPVSLAGDCGSLNSYCARYDEATKMFYTEIGPSMRYVLDWSDIDAFTIHSNLGQSGNPFSPHYDDFLDVWRKGDPWIVPFTRDRVYADKASLLTLKPK